MPRRSSVLLPALIVVAALPCVLFLITPAEAGGSHGQTQVAASGSGSGSWRRPPPPPPYPSGSSSSGKK